MDLATVERVLADLHFPIEEYSVPGLPAPRADDRTYAWTKTFLPATQNPRLSRRFLAHERRSIPDLWFRQEWLVEFVELGNVVFRYEDLLAMMSGDVQPLFGPDGCVQDDEPIVNDVVQPLQLGHSSWSY